MGAALVFESTRNMLGMGSSDPVTKENVSPNLEKFWQPYEEKAFQAALKSGKPTLLDFYADWCAACHELADQTFSDAKVLQKTTEMNLFRFDGTKGSTLFDELKMKYQIVGLPTVLMFDRRGALASDLVLNEFENAEKFMLRLKALEGK